MQFPKKGISADIAMMAKISNVETCQIEKPGQYSKIKEDGFGVA